MNWSSQTKTTGLVEAFAAWAIRGGSKLMNTMRLLMKREHRRRIRRSRRVLKILRTFRGQPGAEARCFGYLRRLDPLVFEEVVLSCLEEAGAFVIRNRRYSGDGGLDGRCWIPGYGLGAVQVKRYGSHIQKQHVREMKETVARKRLGYGLFVHTGRTGLGCYEELRGSRMVLLSGERLLRLVFCRELSFGRIARPDSLERPARDAAGS